MNPLDHFLVHMKVTVTGLDIRRAGWRVSDVPLVTEVAEGIAR
jgi:hypothetical protein